MKNAMAFAIAFFVSTVICYAAVSVFRKFAEKTDPPPLSFSILFMCSFYHFSTILLLTISKI